MRRRYKMGNGILWCLQGKRSSMKGAKITRTAKGGYMAKGLCQSGEKLLGCPMMSIKDNAEKLLHQEKRKRLRNLLLLFLIY
jgi:hypothetical protein